MKNLLFFGFFLFLSFTVIAQRELTGIITDIKGIPLIGASIEVVDGTNTTKTDKYGFYSLIIPVKAKYMLFSHKGYVIKKIELTNSNILDVVLLKEEEELSKMVTTSLGIKRKRKTLGYEITTIAKEQIIGRHEVDMTRRLRGKATGVDIMQTSGMIGSNTNLPIRGYASIMGHNQPLFVVDGIILNTEINLAENFDYSITGANRFLDIDPNNIEEVSILKGLSATVLYGEIGRNGVILINTKNGRGTIGAKNGFEIFVSQSLSYTEISNIPNYQDTYGNGFENQFGWFFSNWGSAFTNLNPDVYGGAYQGEKNGQVLITHPLDQAQYYDDFGDIYKGAAYIYQPYESVENFFDKGLAANTSISIAKNLGNQTSLSATYSYLNADGFLPNLDTQRGGGASNYLKKHNLGLGVKTELKNGLKLNSSFNFVDANQRLPISDPVFGGDGQGIFATLFTTPRSINLLDLPYQSPIDGSNIYYRRGAPIQNPFWILNNGGEYETVQHFFSKLEASYEIVPSLTAFYRLGVDTYQQKRQRQLNKGGTQVKNGEFGTSNKRSTIIDQTINLLYTKKITKDFSFDALLGGNVRSEEKENVYGYSTNQSEYDLFTHDNFTAHRVSSSFVEENTLGAYATATLGFQDYLYFGVQGRNDWTSTLEQANRSVFYPSASLSFLLTEAIPVFQNSPILNYLKFRMAHGFSAGYPNPYQTRNTVFTEENVAVTPTNTLDAASIADHLGNPNLKRERHKELEAGIEARFLYDRIGLNLTVYNKQSSDLRLHSDLAPATGFTSTIINTAALENKGLELTLEVEPIKSKNFRWGMTLNYSRNRNKIKYLLEGIEQLKIAPGDFLFDPSTIIEFPRSFGNYLTIGEPFGVLRGSSFQRDDKGNLMVDNNGNYIPRSYRNDKIGNPNPDFRANWSNYLSWKDFSFGFQWQYIKGGDMYSAFAQSVMGRGLTVDTEGNRSVPVILSGVKTDGTINDIQTYIGDSFFRAYSFADEGSIFDATSIRLREISLSYTLPSSFLSKTPFGQINLIISGENLWYNAPNFPKGLNFDPDVFSWMSDNSRGLEYRTGPSAKKYGLTLNAIF